MNLLNVLRQGMGVNDKVARRALSHFVNIQTVLLPPALLFLFVSFVLPLLLVLGNSLVGMNAEFTLAHFERFFSDTYYLQVLWRTMYLGILATLLTLIPGYLLAYNVAFHPNPRWRAFIIVTTLVPLVVNLVIRVFGWMALLSSQGPAYWAVNTFTSSESPLRLLHTEAAIVIGFVHAHLTFMVIAIASSLVKIDPHLPRAACNLGATPWTIFRTIILPLSVPGILAGSLICFTLNVSDFVSPILLGGQRNRLMTYLIFEQQLYLANPSFAAAQTVILMIAASGILVFGMAVSHLYTRRWSK